MTKDGRNIREKVMALLRAPDYRPRDRNEIAQLLDAKGRDRVQVRKTLRDLERAGEIVRIRKNRYVLPSEADLIAGKLSIHQAGYGFLVPEKSGGPDIFVAAENTGTAMNGDRVVVRISRDIPSRRAKDRHRAEGRCSTRKTFTMSSRTIRESFTTFTCNREIGGHRPPLQLATRLSSVWKIGSRAT